MKDATGLRVIQRSQRRWIATPGGTLSDDARLLLALRAECRRLPRGTDERTLLELQRDALEAVMVKADPTAVRTGSPWTLANGNGRKHRKGSPWSQVDVEWEDLLACRRCRWVTHNEMSMCCPRGHALEGCLVALVDQRWHFKDEGITPLPSGRRPRGTTRSSSLTRNGREE